MTKKNFLKSFALAGLAFCMLMTFMACPHSQTKKNTTTPIKLATPVVSVNAGDGQVTLTWANVANASSYKLVWNGGTAETVTSPVTKTALTNGTTYSYSITAVGNTTHYTDSDPATGNAKPTPPSSEKKILTLSETSTNTNAVIDESTKKITLDFSSVADTQKLKSLIFKATISNKAKLGHKPGGTWNDLAVGNFTLGDLLSNPEQEIFVEAENGTEQKYTITCTFPEICSITIKHDGIFTGLKFFIKEGSTVKVPFPTSATSLDCKIIGLAKVGGTKTIKNIEVDSAIHIPPITFVQCVELDLSTTKSATINFSDSTSINFTIEAEKKDIKELGDIQFSPKNDPGSTYLLAPDFDPFVYEYTAIGTITEFDTISVKALDNDKNQNWKIKIGSDPWQNVSAYHLKNIIIPAGTTEFKFALNETGAPEYTVKVIRE